MALKLRVTGYDAQHMGAVAEHVFDESGGSIGRGDDNEWRLPDPDRVISGTHASIRFANGEYYLRDTSTNGTLLNSVELSRGDERPLHNGDVLRIGKFDIAVEVSGARNVAAPQAAPQQPLIPDAAGSGFDASGSLDPLELLGSGSGSIPSDLPPEGFNWAADAPQEDHAPPEHVGFEPPKSMPDPNPMTPASGSGTVNIPVDWDETGYKKTAPPAAPPEPPRMPEPRQAATHQPAPPAASAPRAGDSEYAGIAAMLRAAGVPPEAVSAATYDVLGQILQVVVHGLLDVLRARAQIKDEFRVAATRLKPVENNPLKFSVNAQDALHNLFGKQNPGFQSPVDAFEDSFDDIKSHQLAMIAGMRAAYDAMLEYFNPDGLEAEFDKGLKRNILSGVLNKSKYWDLYEDLYRHLQKDPDDSFHRLFGDEFGRAYEEQMERLSRMRNK